nr:hypothetical protein [uncultured Fluviicola sp.]
MKYTKYFSSVINQHGSLNLEQAALQTFFNIVHLEAKLKVYESLNQERRFVVRIHSIQEQIKTLTGGLEPKVFMEKLHDSNFSILSKNNDLDGATPWDEHDPYLTDNKKKY